MNVSNEIKIAEDAEQKKIITELTKKLPGGGYYKSFNLKALYNFLYQNTNKIITKL